MMRHISEVMREYDPDNKTDRRKIELLDWFQQYPGQRFDLSSVTSEFKGKFGVGRRTIRKDLNDLAKDEALLRIGLQRQEWMIHDEIIVPPRYQLKAAWRHIQTVFDPGKWTPTRYLVQMGVIWAILTFPFLFFWFLLLILPTDEIGTISQGDFGWLAFGMTVWLIVILVLIYIARIIQSNL